MPAIHCEINIPETESLMFKKALRHLFNSTFVLREKEEKLYRFIARESNRSEISQYLQVIGYDILVEEKAGVAMLTLSEQDEDVQGLRKANIIQFTPLQYHLLLVLWQTYLSSLGNEDGTFIEMGALVDRLKSFGVEVSGQELRAALRLFKKYMLVHFNEDDKGEDAKIRLYPSLQFGWDIPQFKTVADEALHAGEEDEQEEDGTDTEEEDTNEEEDSWSF